MWGTRTEVACCWLGAMNLALPPRVTNSGVNACIYEQQESPKAPYGQANEGIHFRLLTVQLSPWPATHLAATHNAATLHLNHLHGHGFHGWGREGNWEAIDRL